MYEVKDNFQGKVETTNIFPIDDIEVNIEDIKDAVNRNNNIRNIIVFDFDKPENFNELISNVFFKKVDGVLIDINLTRFYFTDLYLGKQRISDGIDLAEVLNQYMPSLPIALYSNDLERYKTRLNSLPAKIRIYEKTNESFDKTLEPFFQEVQLRKRYNTNTLPGITADEFNNYTKQKKYKLIKKAYRLINSDIYFQVMGNYSWLVKCAGIRPEYHGQLIHSENLDEAQERLKSIYHINEIEEVNEKILQEISEDKRRIPFIFWNLSPQDNIKAQVLYYSEFLKGLPSEHNDMFNFQVAEKLSKYYQEGIFSIQEVNDILQKMNYFGKFEFQKSLIKLKRKEIFSSNEIIQIFEPFKKELDNIVLEVFEGSINSIEKDTDTAWVNLRHFFDDDINMPEPFSINNLKRFEVLIVEGAKFGYIVYNAKNGDLSINIDPEF